MKRITTFICPQRIDKLKNALEKVGYPSNAVSYIPSNGNSKHRGRIVSWHGSEYLAVPIDKIKMELTVADKDVDNVRRILKEKAYTNGSNGATNDRFEYALIPRKSMKKEKISNVGNDERVEYAAIAGRIEPSMLSM